MKLSTTLALFATGGVAVAYQDVDQAAINARTLVRRENMATLMTVNTEGEFAGHPTGQVEYIGDCHDDGSMTMIGMGISQSWKNIEGGSKLSVTIRVGDHGPNDQVDMDYPGAIPGWILASPRVSMFGNAQRLDHMSPEETQRIEQCFLAKHPEAHIWMPHGDNSVHDSFWFKFVPQGMHYIGGFGDRAYIGDIPVEKYTSAAPAANLALQVQ